jgi:hypothetical protein
MRRSLTKEALRDLMREIARSAPRGAAHRVFLLGGGTAVLEGWRESTIDADLYVEEPEALHDVQRIKERVGVNIEFVRPEDFVPALEGSEDRHVFIETIGSVSFYHYDPYAQLLSKVVRGFSRDMLDAGKLVASGMVDADRFRTLVERVPESIYASYPALSPDAVREAVDEFLSDRPEKAT